MIFNFRNQCFIFFSPPALQNGPRLLRLNAKHPPPSEKNNSGTKETIESVLRILYPPLPPYKKVAEKYFRLQCGKKLQHEFIFICKMKKNNQIKKNMNIYAVSFPCCTTIAFLEL